ncbi:MAG TPA: hypothetical protein DEP36_17595 [Gammaproteobacteria bacterium]|nr:hypothetical protein [Gammaproteobacteria bacterium]
MKNLRDWESHDETLSILYQATHDIEPPAWLDERILTAAHRAVAPPQPTPATPYSRRRSVRFWAMPVALAATVIMAAGIVRLARETGEWAPRPQMPMESPSSLAEPAAKADTAPAGQRTAESAHQGSSSATSSLAPASPAAPAIRMMRMAPPSSAASSMQEKKAPIAEEQHRQDILQIAPAMRDEEAKPERQAVDRPPKEWLAHIAKLRRQGRIAEARASLEEFQRRYPDYPQPIWEETD